MGDYEFIVVLIHPNNPRVSERGDLTFSDNEDSPLVKMDWT